MATKTKRRPKAKPKAKKKRTLVTDVGQTRIEMVTCMRKGCKFVAFNPDGTYDQVRMAGRRHAQATGHTVQADIVRTITWKGK